MNEYDPEARCPKCGHDRVTSKHCTFGHLNLPDTVRRQCERCKAVWDERPLDREPHVMDAT